MCRAYLNNAATSWPKAPGVREAVCAALDAVPAHPGRRPSAGGGEAARCRALLAGLLGGVEANRIVLTSSATHALNLAIQGVGLQRGDRVLTTVTEHNSVLRPLHHLEHSRGIALDIVGTESSGALSRGAISEALDRGPALVVANHVSNVTGRANDVASLFAAARAAGAITLLDASQSLGYRDVSAEALQADIVAFTGHKGLLGPPGTGGLYVSPRVELEQIIVGGTGVRSDLALHPADMPTRLEAGTANLPAIAGLRAALEWLRDEGEAHRVRQREMSRRLWEGLRSLPAVRLFGGEDEEAPSTVSFTVAGWDVADAGLALEESFGVACRTGLHCAPLLHASIGSAPEGTVRFSVSGFTTDEELELALAAVGRLAA